MSKFTLLTIICLALSCHLSAQVPQSVNYQAVARNSSGDIIKSGNIGFRFSILAGSVTGTVVYSEVHQVMSDENGIVNLKIGEGSAVTGIFGSINWGAGRMYLKTEMDPNGGSNFMVMGTSELVSVPYALYSGSIYVHYSNDTLYIGDQWVYLPGGSSDGGNTVTDYDGNVYNTVQIGTQVWLKENLLSAHYSDGTAINDAYDYDNNSSLGDEYGKLYTWNAAMKGASTSSSVPSGIRGACPDGYHIPSIDEWQVLKDYVSNTYGVGGALIGQKLKEPGTTHWETDNGTDETGFTALGGGQMYMQSGEPQYQHLKEGGHFWSTTELSTNQDQAMWFNFYDSGVVTTNSGANKAYGLSVRCLKN